jgi:hypothetical protein
MIVPEDLQSAIQPLLDRLGPDSRYTERQQRILCDYLRRSVESWELMRYQLEADASHRARRRSRV